MGVAVSPKFLKRGRQDKKVGNHCTRAIETVFCDGYPFLTKRSAFMPSNKKSNFCH